MNVNYTITINSNYFFQKSFSSLKTISNKTVAIALLAIASIASIAIACIKNYMRNKKFDNQENAHTEIKTKNSFYHQTQTKCQTEAGILNSKNPKTLSSSSPKSNLNQEFLLTEAIVEDINFNSKTLSEEEWKSINLSKYSSALIVQLLKYHDHLKFLAPKTVAENLKKIPTDHYFMLTNEQIDQIDFSQLTGDQFIKLMNDNLMNDIMSEEKISQLNLDEFDATHIQDLAHNNLIHMLSPKTICDNIDKFNDKSLSQLSVEQVQAFDLNQLPIEQMNKIEQSSASIFTSKQWNSFDLSKHNPTSIENLLKKYDCVDFKVLSKISAESVGENLFKISPEYYDQLTNEQLKKVNYFLLNDEQLKKINFNQMSGVDFLNLYTSKQAICKDKAKELNLDLFTEAQIENMNSNIIFNLQPKTVADNIKKISPNVISKLSSLQIMNLDITKLSSAQFYGKYIQFFAPGEWKKLDLAKFSKDEINQILCKKVNNQNILSMLNSETVFLNFSKISPDFWKDLTKEQKKKVRKIFK